MKIAFSRVVDYVPEFNDNAKLPPDEQIKCKLKVLTLGHFLQVAETLGKLPTNEKGEVDLEAVAKRGVEEMKPLFLLAPDLFATYVEISGLLDSDGVPITPRDVGNSPVFLTLTSELLAKLAAISMPTSAEVKN